MIFLRRYGLWAGLPRRLSNACGAPAAVTALILNVAPALGQIGGPPPIQLQAPAAVLDLLRQHMSVLRSGGGDVDEAERLRIARDARQQATQLLATEGYFAPEVEVRPPAAGTQGIVIEVKPGERAEVRSVDLQFRGEITRTGAEGQARMQAVRDDWGLQTGMPFRQQDWDAAKQRALQALLAEDYAAAAIAESRAEVDPEASTVALRVVLDSGPPFTLGQLDVSGLENYDVGLIERYSTINPGERYTQERLLALQSTLQNTPYFSSVLVDIDSDPARPQRVPVRVSVRESRPKRLGLGVGYSSNTGARGEVTFRHANLFDRAWNLSSGLRLEQLRQILYADVLLPPTPKEYYDSFGVLFEASDIQGLRSRRAAAGAQRARVRDRIETRLALNLQRERTQVADEPATTQNALALNWSWTYRNVDAPLDPRDGYVFNFQIGGATKLVLSDQNFVRTYVRHQHFFPVRSRDVLAVNAEVGFTAAPSRSGIPEEFLFRAGGVQSVRGYAYQSLGVRNRGATVGGRRLLVGSVEYTHWLEESRWGAAVFYDVGNAWDAREDFRLFSGYGLGVRWKSPAGPLAFDLAYGQRDGRLRPHFSVAIAF